MFYALLCLLPLLLILVFLKNFSFGASCKLPPGPNASLILTKLYQISRNPHIAFDKLAKSYGPLVSFRIGGQLVVIASSPETAKEFTKTNDRVFSGRHLPTTYQYLPGSIDSSIVLSPECNESWKQIRSMGKASIFSSLVCEKNAWIRKRKAMEVMDVLRRKEGEAVNLEEIMFAALSNIISYTMTSRDLFDIQGQDDDDEFRAMMATVNEVIENSIMYGVVDYLPFLKRFDFWSKGKATEFNQKIGRTWGHIIQERRISGKGNDDDRSSKNLLDILIDENKFSDDQIANVLMEILVGATDSTSITTVWLMVELIRNEEILARVREEIAKTVEGDELSDTLLSQCEYFQACIKETLRLHVPAPLLVPHRAIETREVNDYVIPKDSMLFVNAWAIARDPGYWDDAERFKPERFLESKIGFRGTHFEYLPFGTGLRMCPGTNLAFKNVQLIVGSLLHYFDWSLSDGLDLTRIDMKEKFVITLKKDKPLVLIPRLREEGVVIG